MVSEIIKQREKAEVAPEDKLFIGEITPYQSHLA